ncbi:hypothetical protein FNU76_01410 [Chitinimonas arctica]|uniref:Uncharacterized protein n=1 Tax=Chitinimonas arctica TaxID=2594795 RepID=A0A516SAP6_9NEIS|nr:hypothetical protein [Chitinimonas arctica]QDQ25118.1 hypothetical protein FNU76_01410 [Chitinimonas arctica]
MVNMHRISDSANGLPASALPEDRTIGNLNGQQVTHSPALPLTLIRNDNASAAKRIFRDYFGKVDVLKITIKGGGPDRHYSATIKQRRFLWIKLPGWEIAVKRIKRPPNKTATGLFYSALRRVFNTTNAHEIAKEFNNLEKNDRRMDGFILDLKKYIEDKNLSIALDIASKKAERDLHDSTHHIKEEATSLQQTQKEDEIKLMETLKSHLGYIIRNMDRLRRKIPATHGGNDAIIRKLLYDQDVNKLWCARQKIEAHEILSKKTPRR